MNKDIDKCIHLTYNKLSGSWHKHLLREGLDIDQLLLLQAGNVRLQGVELLGKLSPSRVLINTSTLYIVLVYSLASWRSGLDVRHVQSGYRVPLNPIFRKVVIWWNPIFWKVIW